MKTLVNLTPHPLTISTAAGSVIKLPKSELPARLAVTRHRLNDVTLDTGETLEVNISQLGEIENLPEPQEGVILVVSALVADAAKRGDVMSPGELLRDGEGNIVGAKGLCAYSRH
jgi:hypothetical protein